MKSEGFCSLAATKASNLGQNTACFSEPRHFFFASQLFSHSCSPAGEELRAVSD